MNIFDEHMQYLNAVNYILNAEHYGVVRFRAVAVLRFDFG